MSAADMIAMGVEVISADDEVARPFPQLFDIIEGCGSYAGGVREVIRMIRDASDAAAGVHDVQDVLTVDASLASDVLILRRVSALMTAAMEELK